MLLYRGDARVDESIQSYISRLAFWNGFRDEKSFRKNVLAVHREVYGMLEWKWLNNVNYNLNDRLWYECTAALECMFGRNLRSVGLIPGRGGPGREKQFTEDHWLCEECWIIDPYYRVYWYLDNYCICHIHDCPLVYSSGFYSELGIRGDAQRILKNHEATSNYKLLDAAVKLHSSGDEIVLRIYNAIWESEYLAKVVESLEDICKIHLSLSINSKKVIDACLSGEFIGEVVSRLMEKVVRILVGRRGSKVALMVKAVLSIVIKSSPLKTSFYNRSRKRITCFEHWADEQIFSLEPLLLAYNCCAFGRRSLHEVSLKCELPGFSKISSRSEEFFWELIEKSFDPGGAACEKARYPQNNTLDLLGKLCSSRYVPLVSQG